MIRCVTAATALCFCAFVVGQTPAEANLAKRFREALEAQRNGRLDEAAKAYRDVLALRPDLAEAYVNLGLVLQEEKQFQGAVAALESAVRLKPSLAGAYLFLGISNYSLGKIPEARKALEDAVRLMPEDARAQMWLALANLQAGRLEDAAAHIDRAAALAPKDVDVLYHRGRIHLRISQESYREMFKSDPKSARVHQVLAQSFEESGRDEEAIAEYELTQRLNPNLPGINDELGSLYWKNNKLQEAEAAFTRELALDPHNALAMFKLGTIRFRLGNTIQGMPLLESAVKQAPDLLDARYYLGKAQAELGKNEAAIQNLKRVVDGDPSGPLTESAHYQLAQIYRRMGLMNQAEAALGSYRKLKAEHDQARSDKLENLKKRLPE